MKVKKYSKKKSRDVIYKIDQLDPYKTKQKKKRKNNSFGNN